MRSLLSKSIYVLFFTFILSNCGEEITFNDQITNDIQTKMATGICKDIPNGSTISNIKIGKIDRVKGMGTNVSIEFDYEVDGEIKHHSSFLLYIENGNKQELAAIGRCDYSM